MSAGFKPGTLGIFFWGRPIRTTIDGTNVTVIFMDTEARNSGADLEFNRSREWGPMKILQLTIRSSAF